MKVTQIIATPEQIEIVIPELPILTHVYAEARLPMVTGDARRVHHGRIVAVTDKKQKHSVIFDRYAGEIDLLICRFEVFVDGKKLATHHGGYSTWRVDLTEALAEESILAVTVDNSPNETVYPQMADFTFYGGLYRSVNLICVPESHFDLGYYGGPGIAVTPVVEGEDAKATVEVWLTDRKEGQTVRYTLCNKEGKTLLYFQNNQHF